MRKKLVDDIAAICLYTGMGEPPHYGWRKLVGAALDVAFAPPSAPAQPLSDEQIVEIRDALLPSQGESFDTIAFARAIERAHGIAAPASGEGDAR